MAKPLRLRTVTERLRSGSNEGLASSVRNQGLSATAPETETETRDAPWLAFNATRLPTPVAECAPEFGPKRFLLGANLPWVRYGLDFGASAEMPEGGLHANAESRAALDEALGRLRRDGVEHARIFLFCDGRAGLRFSADGAPEGLDESVFEDVDVLLATAERHRIGLVLVLFDAGLVAGGGSRQGHADVLEDASKRDALLQQVVEPLLRRYGQHPAIDAWDLFDEPECATVGMQCPHPQRTPGARRWGWVKGRLTSAMRAVGLDGSSPEPPRLVSSTAMRSFLGAAVQAVHLHTRALATVGLASTANLGLVEGLGLDFYQAHWWEAYGDAPLRRAAADFHLDRPLVLGAFPAAMQHKSVKTVLDTARCAGYGGAFVWSLRAVDSRGALDTQLASWVHNHATHLYRRPPRVEAAAPPPPEVAPPPLPPKPVAAETAVDAASTFDADEDEPRSARVEDGDVPGLAAAPG